MQHVYIVDAVRTPIGSYGGALASQRPDDLAALVVKKLMERNPQLPATALEEVVFGAANQSGEDNRNVARMAALLAGLPVSVAGVTVNRLCASGLQAVIDATRALKLGEGQAYIAGGVESMSRAPFVQLKHTSPYSRHIDIADTTIGWRFTNPQLAAMYHPYSMGETAENVAQKWNISREAQDQFALSSQQKYHAAHQQQRFDRELVPVSIYAAKDAPTIFTKDEHPRQTSLEKLANLKPAFLKPHGSVTAGNSSGINDGAAAVLLVSEATLQQYQLQPLARVVSVATAGVEPAYMGVGPVPAMQKALQRAQLSVSDIDVFELNEAFAAQVLACVADLQIPLNKVNPLGGAIALGHPLGCSGARIITTLTHYLHSQPQLRYGLATMCVGVGQGAAVIIERM